LTDISRNDTRTEAFLYDRYNNRKTRLRASVGFDTFKILGDHGEERVRGKVIQITQRDVIFRVDENYYAIHIGQNLETALRKSWAGDKEKGGGLVPARARGAAAKGGD